MSNFGMRDLPQRYADQTERQMQAHLAETDQEKTDNEREFTVAEVNRRAAEYNASQEVK
jgi:hypothetical protein